MGNYNHISVYLSMINLRLVINVFHAIALSCHLVML